MLKSNRSLFIALLFVIVWGIHNYDMNSQCYEIVSVEIPVKQDVLLNKCKGRTWALANDEFMTTDVNDNGEEVHKKVKTMSWARIEHSGGVLSYGSAE